MKTQQPMNLRKPSLEKISQHQDDSMLIRQFHETARDTRPFWHYHPELELVYVNGGNGKRHIGSHLSYFHDGELVLIGSGLPHQGFTNRLSGHKSETVIHWRPDFLGESFFQLPEMRTIRGLLERSKMGLSFHGESKTRIGERVENLIKFDSFDRIVNLLSILKDLANSTEYKTLNANGLSIEVERQDNDRINIVFNYVREHFKEPIALEVIADLVSMTEPSFCRYFKKLTGKTFTRFVNDYRLVHASKLLSEEKMSITEICYASGFSNFSHFNKQFKLFTSKSPSEYRNEVLQIVD